MGYINTGLKRSLTFQVTKEVNGSILYTHDYNGQLAGTYNGHVYALLPSSPPANPCLALLSAADYETRLYDFKISVATLEPGIDFTSDIVAGFEPTKTDLGDCPIPVVSTTSTTIGGTTSTTTTTQNPRRNINVTLSYGGTAGTDNGIAGEVIVCGSYFNVAPYMKTTQNINTTGLVTNMCAVDLSNIIMYLSAMAQAAYIYFRHVGDSDWEDISASKYGAILVSGNATVNVEVLVQDTPMALSCNYFKLTKTDWGDNQRALFDVINCTGDASTMELPDNEEVLVCLHDAIPVNSEDTAVIIMNCTDGDYCHSMRLVKTVDDAEAGTFNCVNCNGVGVQYTVPYGTPLTVCLNSATPVNPNDTATIIGVCQQGTSTSTTTSTTTTVAPISGILYMSGEAKDSDVLACAGLGSSFALYIIPGAGLSSGVYVYTDQACTTKYLSGNNKYFKMAQNGVGTWYSVHISPTGLVGTVTAC